MGFLYNGKNECTCVRGLNGSVNGCQSTLRTYTSVCHFHECSNPRWYRCSSVYGCIWTGASVKRGSLCSECTWRWTVWFVVHCCYIMKNGQSHVLLIHECIRYIYQYRLNWSMLKGHHSNKNLRYSSVAFIFKYHLWLILSKQLYMYNY